VTPPLFLLDVLPDGDVAQLCGDEGRHAATVRRITPGEAVRLGDGRGGVLDATVIAVRDGEVQFAINARRVEPAPDPSVVVMQALPKGDRSELTVELLTELGVDEIVPWRAARSVAQWRDGRAERALAKWRRTAREAAKQSRRAWVPAVADPAGTAEVADRLAAAALGIVLHEAAAAGLGDLTLPTSGEIVVVVGPEGGITDAELASFGAGIAIRLGGPVLRTSTAGAAVLAALSPRLGRWS
jgi:16S rRNA (uracil1498-N3)-methyltransferase